MAGPWEKYAAQSRQGPWTKYAKQPEPQQAQQTTSAVGDMFKSAGSGLARGAAGLIGLPGDLNSGMGWAIGAARDYLIGDVTPEQRASIDAARKAGNILPTSEGIRTATSNVTGMTLPEPKTTAGEYARTVGEFVPASLLGPGSMLRKILGLGVIPGLASEAGGQMTEGTAAEPYARVAGAIAGGIAPSLARRAITPLPTSPAREALAQTLRREGVDVSAGQRTGSHGLRYAEHEIGGTAAMRLAERQGEQFTRAALSRAGVNANRATPEVVDRAFTRIGQQFDNLAARNDLAPVNRQLVDDLVGPQGVLPEYQAVVAESARAPIVQNLILDIGRELTRGGRLTGAFYQATRSRLDRAARAAKNSDPQLSEALFGIRNALDDAMEQSLAVHNPADLGVWQEARRQYRNMLVIERAATGAGEAAATGIISPAQLRNATVNVHGRRNYARGRGEFDELARAGEGIMRPLPNSGTPGRLRAQNLGAGITSILGAGGGAHVGGPLGAAVGAAAGAAIPRVVGRAMMSRPGQAYLGNQRFQPQPRLPSRELVRAFNAWMAARHE